MKRNFFRFYNEYIVYDNHPTTSYPALYYVKAKSLSRHDHCTTFLSQLQTLTLHFYYISHVTSQRLCFTGRKHFNIFHARHTIDRL